MAWKVVWTEAAWNDLDAIANHIAKDSRHYAAAFVREVQEAAESSPLRPARRWNLKFALEDLSSRLREVIDRQGQNF